jgi:heat shock protein HslJ
LHYLPGLSIPILRITNMRKQILSITKRSSGVAKTCITLAMLINMGCHAIKAVVDPPDEPLATKLQGTWVLTYLSGPEGAPGAGFTSGPGIAIDGLYPNKKPLINFDLGQNEVNGNTSCNPFSSKERIDGNKISISRPFAMTSNACDGGGEKAFLDMLNTITGFSVSHNDVLTFFAGDVAVMRFTRK